MRLGSEDTRGALETQVRVGGGYRGGKCGVDLKGICKADHLLILVRGAMAK